VPVVLVEVGGVARSGHEYDDRTGIAYEYPSGRYERWIRSGERFLYQVPKVGYTGCGVVGEIRPSSKPGRLICDVLSVRRFHEPVSLKDAEGSYYEADPTFWRDRVYWGQGVRPLSDRRLDAILSTAYAIGIGLGSDPEGAAAAYVDPATARKVEDYSVRVAVAAMKSRFAGMDVFVMPRNNPGFDLRVGPSDYPTRYVEVKGTQSAEPLFFMSDGERRFSLLKSDRYTLIVVCGIDIKTSKHGHVVERDGAVQGTDFELQPNQWRGRIVSGREDPNLGSASQSCELPGITAGRLNGPR